MAALGGGFYFKHVYEKMVDPEVVESKWDMESVGEMILKRVPSLLPKTYSVNYNGQPLFQIQPTKRRVLNRRALKNLGFLDKEVFQNQKEALSVRI